MPNDDRSHLDSHDAWNTNARFWDTHMGEGNDILNLLVWPAVVRLLPVRAGDLILDIACGNGLTSRRLFESGTRVVAIDFSEELVDIARKRKYGSEIDYRVLDATDYEKLVDLGPGKFDAALCNMAFMDIADLFPLMKALARLLRPGSAFVFSTLHPCFNNPSSVHAAELEDNEGTFEMTYSVKVSKYMTPFSRPGAATHGQPVPHVYYHRSLSGLLAPGLDSGFVLDGLEECAFAKGHRTGTTVLSWSGAFSEIPPILVVRLRLGA